MYFWETNYASHDFLPARERPCNQKTIVYTPVAHGGLADDFSAC